MKIGVLSLAFLTILSACQSQERTVSIGAPAKQALKTTELRSDGLTRLKTLAAQTELRNNALFKNYNQRGVSRWNDGWTKRIDFSGVAWSHRQAGTAITPRHIVIAAHFPLGLDTSISFHDRSGVLHKRKVIERLSLRDRPQDSRHDIMVLLLDTPLPPSVKTYRLLPPRTDYGHTLIDCPAIVTEQKRRAFIHKVRSATRGRMGFKKNTDFPDELYKGLIKGDSGNPSFLLVGGEPVLIETHTGGGAGGGPFYSDPVVFKALTEAVAKLDPAYKIETVPLDPQLAPAPPKTNVKPNSPLTPASKPSRPAGATTPTTPTQKTKGNRFPRVRRVPVPE